MITVVLQLLLLLAVNALPFVADNLARNDLGPYYCNKPHEAVRDRSEGLPLQINAAG